MSRTLMVATIAAALAMGPVVAQQGLQRPAAALVGLPVFTSDGQLAGRISNLGRDVQGQAVLIAELDRPLGIGPRTVAIPIDLFVQRPDRIELTITGEQVSDRLAGPERSTEK